MTQIPEMKSEVVYQLVVNARMSASDEAYKKCLSDLTRLGGFSYSRRDDKEQTIEYRHIVAGKTKCRFQISPRELSVETSREGVDENSWNEWSRNILGIVSNAMDWNSRDLSVLATMHRYRFQKLGNNFEFLRDAFFTNSKIYELIEDLKLLDTEIVFRAILEEDIKLFIRVTGNQQMEEILSGALSDEDSRVIFEFHAVRLDLKCNLSVVDALKIQEEKLKAWLNSGKLDNVLETLG